MESLNKDLYIYQYVDVIKDAMAKGLSFRLDAIGESMSPTIKEGDSIILCKADTIKKGDIALYQVNDTTFYLHRVLKVMDDMLIIAGDNNVIFERVPVSSVIAKVENIVKGKKVIKRNSIKYRIYHSNASIRRFFRRGKNKAKRWIKRA